MEVARKRRMQTKRCEAKYFDKTIWPNHLAYKQAVFSWTGATEQIRVIDGTLNFHAILPVALEALSQSGGPRMVNEVQAGESLKALTLQSGLKSSMCTSP